MYQAVCDECASIHFNELYIKDRFDNARMAVESAVGEGWQEIDGKLYCPDCLVYDEETDSYKPKKKE